MRFYIIILMLCMLIIPLVSAANNTTGNITTYIPTETYTHIMPTPEEFYGNVTYSDGSKIPSGTEILALDQRGKIVGRFIMTTNGTYGDQYQSTPRLIINADYPDDTLIFYVGETKTLQTMAFDSSSIKRLDLVLPVSAKPTLTPESNPSLTTEIPTVISTQIPTSQKVNGTLINNIPTQPPKIPTQSSVSTDATPKFIGVLFMAIAICVIGAILTYFILTKKMKREDEEEIIL